MAHLCPNTDFININLSKSLEADGRSWDCCLRVAEDPDLRYVNGHPELMQIIDLLGEFIPPMFWGRLY
jgi:hypothetical protein